MITNEHQRLAAYILSYLLQKEADIDLAIEHTQELMQLLQEARNENIEKQLKLK